MGSRQLYLKLPGEVNQFDAYC